MSLSVEIEGVEEVVAKFDQVKEDVANVQTILQEVGDWFLPEVLVAAGVWGVRTGLYVTSWYAHVTVHDTGGELEVGNTAPYAASLEHGWMTKGGGFRSSPGVLFPTFETNQERMVEAITAWLNPIIQR